MGLLKSVTNRTVQNNHNYIGAPSFRTNNPALSFLDLYDSDKYASIYPSIKSIANEFMKIRPFAIGSNGEPRPNVPVLNALYHPNQTDSSVAFFEKLAVMALTHRKTYLLVWRNEAGEAQPGGPFASAGNNIVGFTFLEQPGISRRDGVTYYNVGSQYFTENEVITITGGVNPHDLYGGYAPGEASRRWATLDEYIADFQQGFFENGAVPAGQFIITASSKTDYEDTKRALQSKHRGAGNNNNITYTPRPVDPATGKPGDSKIEWIPFQQSNREIDFKNLFEQANKRIDSSFGVPASIRGVGENNNYATARLDQQNFIRFTIEPLALRIYTQITHELNRITGGLGYAISFKLEYPAIADEEKVQAETKNVEVSALRQLLDEGFTLESAIEALQLSNSYKLLKEGESTETVIDNDKPDVDEGDEVGNAPDPDKIDGITPLNSIKNASSNYDELYAVARGTMKRQVDKAVSELEESDIQNAVNPDPTIDEEDQFIEDMIKVIAGIILAIGVIQYALGKELLEKAGVSTDTLTAFTFTDLAETRYRTYLRKVGTSYMTDTADKIRKVLDDAKERGLNLADTKRNLRGILNTDEYRIKRLAETELNRSQAMGSIESMIEIQNQSGATLEKGLVHTGGDLPCEFCAVLLDRWVVVDQTFVLQGETIVGVNGGMYINDFTDNDGYDIHPNGHCSPQYRVREEDSITNEVKRTMMDDVKLRCTDCDRFLKIEPLNTTITKVTCTDRKCKKVNNIKVVYANATDEQIRYTFEVENE